MSHSSSFPGRRAAALALALGTAASLLIAPVAGAAPDGSQVLINEVYGGGGNSGAVLTHDFIELYNPTDREIDLAGMKVEYFAATGNSGGTVELSGTIAPEGHYLINMAAGNNGSVTATADATGTIAMAARNGSVLLSDATGAQLDLVGYGTATRYEGTAAGALSNTTSAQRSPEGRDTDNNAADFHVSTPTPTNAAGKTFGPGTPPTDPGEPDEGEVIPIAEIQGTGETTPYLGRTVTTEGIVTAVYAEGGRHGFTVQTAGTGSDAHGAGDASHGIFIHLGAGGQYPEIGEAVSVTGTAEEYYGTTQIGGATVHPAEGDFAAVVPLEITTLPAGDEDREAYESMLVLPTGTHTVTNNYQLNAFGEIGLAPGEEAFWQPTDIVLPGADATALDAENQANLIILDDGRTTNYARNDQETPLPYLAAGGTAHQSIRTGDQVEFQHPIIVDYDHGTWRYQPTTPITGANSAAELPITWEDSRPATLAEIDSVAGDYTIGSFNVLNYFTSLGEAETGCSAYEDRNGVPVTANYCDVRGAYTPAAFADQQNKIISAINLMDVDVLGLEEIENTATVTGDPAARDFSLAHLVDKLNDAADASRWAYVASPAQVGTDEDYIRVAFIYDPSTVEPVGESRIFNNDAYTGVARQPLAQEFQPIGGGQSFIAVTNHFKSKGSIVRGDSDRGDGQGNNPTVRNTQAQALLDHLDAQDDWADLPIFLLGDLNAYSREDAIRTLEANGYTNLNTEYAGHEPTYQFDGYLGSLDHAFGNDTARNLVQDAVVWNINADEPIAYEYSRRNYNIVDFHDDSPFRSSDHDPIKVGFNLAAHPERFVTDVYLNEAGRLIVEYSDGEIAERGIIPGVTIEETYLTEEGDTVVIFSDGTELLISATPEPERPLSSSGSSSRLR